MDKVKKYHLSKFKKLLFIFPFLYLIHDIEEILTVEKFLNENSNIIPYRVTTMEFAFAFTLLWVLASIGCYKAFIDRKFIGMNQTTYLSLLVPGILLANGITHLLQFIFFKDYIPGILTSIFILFPYSVFTAKFLITERELTLKSFLVYLILGFVLQVPLALVALYISKLIFSLL
jgi:hypothetical protein